MRMCAIPAGAFWMGSDPPEGQENEHPRRRVTTGGYEISETPVTNADFEQALAKNDFYSDRLAWSGDGWAWRTANGIAAPRFRGDERWRDYLAPDQPVVGVSWYEADAFGRTLGLRLPTEAELERAAGGGEGQRYRWRDEGLTT